MINNLKTTVIVTKQSGKDNTCLKTMKTTSQILKQLRGLMKNLAYVSEPIQAYIVPSSDRHQNEYLRICDKRRDYVSGFTGSAGTAVITEENACLWTDGRYYLQASQEMDDNWTLMKEGDPSTPSQSEWLETSLPSPSRVGVDPWLISYSTWKEMESSFKNSGHVLVPIPSNLVDVSWHDRPAIVQNSVIPLSINFTGKTSRQKINDVLIEMAKKKATTLILTALDEIAWLFNLRGSDIFYNPVFFAYAALSADNVYLFIDKSKLPDSVKEHFASENLQVIIKPYEEIDKFIESCVPEMEGKIWMSKYASYHLHSLIPNNQRISDITPVCNMKALKNPVEAQGLVNCHIRDGAALCRYFAWLENTVPLQNITEVTGADKLELFRRELKDFVDLSFPTISSSGPNAAIIHYQPQASTARSITTDEIYLCDSGAHYKDGTTDVTRTLHLGSPSKYEKECFTRVLKGQIALALAVFPTFTKGHYLDSFARKFLWDAGLNYQHGTGHGIGHYLNVHEGPMGISWRVYPDDPGLQKGMFLSNEPGYYEDGHFGIRLENIIQIVAADTPYNFKKMGFLTFETVTLVPVQTKLIEFSLLTDQEVTYLNEYHKKCRTIIGPLLEEIGDKEALLWLEKETKPIG